MAKTTTPHADAIAALGEEKRRLATRLAELERSLSELSAEAEVEVQFDEEGGEGDAGSVEVDQVRALLAAARSSREEVAAAEARIEAGTYGMCTGCGQPIAPERLAVLPTATECVACKGAGVFARRRRS
jgi:DnaK suppressor protein